MKTISIISPCYNEEDAVNSFFDAVNKEISKLDNYKFEIIIVNDGSTDKTLTQLQQHLKTQKHLKIINLNRNFGKERALTAGIDNCQSDAAIIVDFDLQDPLNLIPELIKNWEEGFESVVGIRVNRDSDNLFKKFSAKYFYKIYNIFSDIKIPENAGDYRLIDKKIITQLKQLPERQRFMKGIFSWIGANTKYVNFTRQKRIANKTKFSNWKLWNFAIEGITSFSTLPLRIWTYIGFFISSISFIYAIFIITRTIFYGIDLPGYSSIIVTILFLGGIQVMGIGILGEYLGRIYFESKNRPIYLIRDIFKS